jgi:AcrR family transcriptional regulator
MTPSPQSTDRRVGRTRQLVRQASIEVVRDKGFRAARVRDIAERANINRSTFYAHFADKYALADAFVRDEFRDLVAAELPPVSQWTEATVGRLIGIVLERARRQTRCRDAELLHPLLQHAVQDELAQILLAWLEKRPEPATRVPAATAADIASWTILGAACSGTPAAPEHILSMVMGGLTAR